MNYELRAKEICLENNIFEQDKQSLFIKLMCQISNEIEKDNNNILILFNELNKKYNLLSSNLSKDSNNYDVFLKTIENSYNKQDVEELIKNKLIEFLSWFLKENNLIGETKNSLNTAKDWYSDYEDSNKKQNIL